jgi:hypothetical protein
MAIKGGVVTATAITGGCQCGAVRYSIEGAPQSAAICHCRMCQKAVGSIVWPYFTVSREALTWTRGALAHYRSSAAASRGFCAACGTPLTFEPAEGDTVDLGIGTLDSPDLVNPTEQYWIDGPVSWFGELDALPRAGLGSLLPADERARRKPFQHPDHDTDRWPPEGAVR